MPRTLTKGQRRRMLADYLIWRMFNRAEPIAETRLAILHLGYSWAETLTMIRIARQQRVNFYREKM